MTQYGKYLHTVSLASAQVRKMLEGPTLGVFLADRVLTCPGTWNALAPPGVTDERLQQTLHGALWKDLQRAQLISPTWWLAEALADLAKDQQPFNVVLSDAIARPGDGGLQDARARLLFYGDKVYQVFDAAPPSKADLEFALRDTHSLPYCFGAGGPASLPEVATDRDKLHRFAMRATLVYISAFDGESYFVWQAD